MRFPKINKGYIYFLEILPKHHSDNFLSVCHLYEWKNNISEKNYILCFDGSSFKTKILINTLS